MMRFMIASIFSFGGLLWFFGNTQLPEHRFNGTDALFKLDHSAWDALLKEHVATNGNVDYKAFKNHQKALVGYLEYLSKNEPNKNWPKNEALSYYINLYNAATVQLILENHPIKSIKNINSPWGKKTVAIGDKKYSLGDIEHKILRKMDEPRIHFAINCASYSCPKLLNRAFTAMRMETQLQKATKDFINDTKRNVISKDELRLSNIFKWYKKDFKDKGSLIDYIDAYTETEISPNAKIEFLKYDWSLNEAK